MATPVSLGTLMLRARRRADLENTGGANGFLPDDEVIDLVNTSIAAWWDLVRMTTFMGQIARSAWPITTTSNVSVYPLAPDTASVISVDANVNGAILSINACPYQEEQRNLFKTMPFIGWSVGALQSLWYQLQGTNINFLPTPPSQTSFTVNYVPTAPVLADPENDYLNSINGWEEWIVIKTAQKMLIKDGQTDMVAALMPFLAEERERILACAAQMDMNASEGVHETEAYGSFSGLGWNGNW
jgi:hypothetical protein